MERDYQFDEYDDDIDIDDGDRFEPDPPEHTDEVADRMNDDYLSEHGR